MDTKKELSQEQREDLLDVVKERFENNMTRHPDMEWEKIQAKLEAQPDKLWSLNEMEETGGEPDVVGYDEAKDQYIFYDCVAESPKGRRSLCYDRHAWESRTVDSRPANTVIDMAEEMGIRLLTEEEYFALQRLGEFDTKTSSWVEAPVGVRERGGAIFGDLRFGRVFIYHNGASSYYAARGFRGSLRV